MRGLFGKTKGLEGMKLPAMDAPLPNEITYTPKAQAIMSGDAPMPAAPQGKGLKDILLAALGGAADGAATFFGGQPLIAQNRQFQQMAAMRQAEQERQRSMELADYRTKLQIQQEFQQPRGPDLGTFEDNAGNVWSYDKRTNQIVGDKPFFIDRAQRTMIQDGALIRVPNPFASAPSGQQGGYAEGTVIENDRGERMVLRNGQWQPAGGAGSNASGNFRP